MSDKELPERGNVRIVITIEGPTNGHNDITVVTTGVHKDGTVDGPVTDRAESDSLMGAIMLASQELRKLGLLMSYEILDKLNSLAPTGDAGFAEDTQR